MCAASGHGLRQAGSLGSSLAWSVAAGSLQIDPLRVEKRKNSFEWPPLEARHHHQRFDGARGPINQVRNNTPASNDHTRDSVPNTIRRRPGAKASAIKTAMTVRVTMGVVPLLVRDVLTRCPYPTIKLLKTVAAFFSVAMQRQFQHERRSPPATLATTSVQTERPRRTYGSDVQFLSRSSAALPVGARRYLLRGRRGASASFSEQTGHPTPSPKQSLQQ
jgi:hypothetical protein